MNADEYEMERGTSAPIDMLEHYFNAHGWAYERAEEEIVATFQGSWAQYELRAIWREDDHVLQFLALPDIRVSSDKRAATYETIGLINEQLWLGHFDLWKEDGLLLYRNGLLLAGADTHVGQCEALLKAALEACERYYQSFQFVLWAGKSPEDALAATLLETQGQA